MQLTELTELRAGSLRMLYDNGGLRYIKWGDKEILRRIYVALRDRNWETIPAVISILDFEQEEHSFRVLFEATHREREINFVWRGEITGDSEGVIRFTFDGEARSTFLRNRIGFCVLHPAELAGETCRVRYANGSEYSREFPQLVAKEQPITAIHDLGDISHEVTPGLWAEVKLSGDLFEMEDQRNWIDASFKTYCTPLRIPFPLEIVAGTRITQTIELRLRETEKFIQPVAKSAPERIVLSRTGQRFGLPQIGFGLSHHVMSSREIERMAKLKPSHLRIDLKLAEIEFGETLMLAINESSRLNTKLEIALFLSENAEEELQSLVTILNQHQPRIARWLIFDKNLKSSSARSLQLARQFLQGYGALIGGGTSADFYDLNQPSPPATMMDFVTFSMNPQMHAVDNLSMIEALTVIPHPVLSAKQYFSNLPVVVSPITLKPRFNTVATDSAMNLLPNQLPASVDARQATLFGAGWTLGAVKRLAESEAASVTCFETTGWHGVMETENGSPLPEQFSSVPGSVFPLYHVLADVAEFVGGEVLAVQSGDALKVEALILTHGERQILLLANLTAEPQTVTMDGINQSSQVRRLHAQNLESAMSAPEIFRSQFEPANLVYHSIELTPYEIVRLDW